MNKHHFRKLFFQNHFTYVTTDSAQSGIGILNFRFDHQAIVHLLFDKKFLDGISSISLEKICSNVVFTIVFFIKISKNRSKIVRKMRYYLGKNISNRSKNLVLYINQQALQDETAFAPI